MAHHKLLIVEDEADIRVLLRESLESTYEIIEAESVSAGVSMARQHKPDVMLIDVRLPDGSGVDLCKTVREDPALRRTKVIMLTGQGDQETIVRSFGLGADDYITKPFNLAVLRARIDSKARRVEEESGVTLSLGNLTLYPDQLSAKIGDKKVSFSVLEFSLLDFFLQNKDKIASRKQILKKVWPNTVVSDRTIDAHIVSLRKKLEGFDYEIKTFYGAGYGLQSRHGLSNDEPAAQG